MSRAFKILSYAKLNLALSVTGKRPDGFHEIESLFERIDLCDELLFSTAPRGQIIIVCAHPDVPVDERNIVYKAAQLLCKRYGIEKGVKIVISKRIPVAAGLAGGSSNAASALRGLNIFWNLGLSAKSLLLLAQSLGSDVAFFMHDVSFGLGTGRGEKIKPVWIDQKFWHLLVTPKQPLLTKDVYAAWSCALTREKSAVSILIDALRKNDVSEARHRLFNDLEGAISRLRPSLLKLKARLFKAAGNGVCFSGSGPSIFALMANRQEAEFVASIFRRTYSQVFVVSTF